MENSTSRLPEWTITALLKWTTSYFKSHDIDSPRTTAEILLAHILKLKRIDLYLRYDQPLSSDELLRFKTLIKRRIKREPVAYIVGTKEFWSLDLAVTPDVLIPRPETECLVEAALELLPEGSKPPSGTDRKRILDLGTGSGAIILAMASQCKGHLFYASDFSFKAVALARENARRHGLDQAVYFFCGDWLMPLGNTGNRFDMILSNPPYIPARAIDHLQPEIYKYEPMLALEGDEDGLDCIRLIIEGAHRFLNPCGSLLLEIGHDQKTAIKTMIHACGEYEQIVFKKDYSGKDRIVRVRKKP
jgi:release factor glutamine methyltransferase